MSGGTLCIPRCHIGGVAVSGSTRARLLKRVMAAGDRWLLYYKEHRNHLDHKWFSAGVR
ncbi:hypothetical protein BX257_8491 [Streptomyces sp. 3212.3]|uniref:hypothetical protein n=1 Tax=Streptomyces sp. 3212.3 TaxID=1938846 RepID=UPI000E365D3D|nr:hypothetical protein [Streptomyces sp. 3212.3]REE65739.1 hypothetical protein BX257_8491 [Streptomyces sp. 3212.3]